MINLDYINLDESHENCANKKREVSLLITKNYKNLCISPKDYINLEFKRSLMVEKDPYCNKTFKT